MAWAGGRLVVVRVKAYNTQSFFRAFFTQGMAWAGGRLVVATSLRYMLLDPASGAYVQLFALPEEAPPPTLVQAIPGADLALLLMARSLAALC